MREKLKKFWNTVKDVVIFFAAISAIALAVWWEKVRFIL
jgi:hypothetical protein